MSLFFPTLYRRCITDVTVEDLHRLGAEAVLLDVDNTLTTHDAPDLTDGVKTWLAEMQTAGFSLIIVSNNRAERVAPFADKIGLPYTLTLVSRCLSGFVERRNGPVQTVNSVLSSAIRFSLICWGRIWRG